MRALIVESHDTRGALAACRALARAGWTVGIGSPNRHGLAGSSRYAHGWHEVPEPTRDLDAFLDATERAILAGRYETVLCSQDAHALALSLGRDRLSASVPFPPHDVVLRAFDKWELYLAAQRVGMATPATMLADDAAIADSSLPVVVKARLHWTPGSGGTWERLPASICVDRDQVRRQVAMIQEQGGRAVLQEVVRGRQVHYLVVVGRSGEIVVGVQTTSARLLYPGPDVGQRVRSMSVPVDPRLHEKTTALMKEIGWIGLTSLMWIRPDDGGEPALTDFNGRLQAFTDQYVAAGPNVPALWAGVVTGRPLPPVGPVRAGVRYQWLEGDLRRAVRQRRVGLLRDLAETLWFAPGAVHTLWRWNDPRPAFVVGIRQLRRLGAGAVRRARALAPPPR